MRISILGLGYVGSVSLGCLAKLGHTVIGIDIQDLKNDLTNLGKSSIIEDGLESLISEGRDKGLVKATKDINEAILDTELTFICVGTPSTTTGHLDLEGILKAARDIGTALISKRRFHTIAIRSTVFPGTNRRIAKLIAEISGKEEGLDFAVVSNPEFLREGSAVKDYFSPPFTLIGSDNSRAIEVMKEVYGAINAEIIFTEYKIAELLKYINNSYHALKVVFANEVGLICKHMGINSHEIMRIFCKDDKLNISPAYLRPGFAFGGSCLPKDLRALCTMAHDAYITAPVLTSISKSNANYKEYILTKILSFGLQHIGFLGLSFKEGTDDLRSSPAVDILESLIGKGFHIKVYDKNVQYSKLIGGNLEFINSRIPIISRFITTDHEEILKTSEIIVVVNKEREFSSILEKARPETIILDLANIDFEGRAANKKYFGVAW